MPPLVSIITTSYNHAPFVGRTISSILSQSYRDFELIVSDDASTDGSLDIIRSFDDKRLTTIAAEHNQGASIAYAKAYAQTRGVYFASVDSDDCMAPGRLDRQVAWMEEHSEIDILGTHIVPIDATGARLADEHAHWFNGDLDLNDPTNWVRSNHLCHSSVLLRRTFHDRIGLPNGGLRYTPDYELWLRFLAAGARFAVLAEPLTCYRFHGANITHQDPRRSYWEYAWISATVLHPILRKRGRHDLLLRNLFELVKDASIESATLDHRLALAALLLASPPPSREEFSAFFAELAAGGKKPPPPLAEVLFDLIRSTAALANVEITLQTVQDKLSATLRSRSFRLGHALTEPWRRLKAAGVGLRRKLLTLLNTAKSSNV